MILKTIGAYFLGGLIRCSEKIFSVQSKYFFAALKIYFGCITNFALFLFSLYKSTMQQIKDFSFKAHIH